MADSSSLQAFIKSLDERKLKNIFGQKTMLRGQYYYANGHVLQVEYQDNKTRLVARVQGQRQYKVVIEMNNDYLECVCSCPVGGSCKHAVAVLLSAISGDPEEAEVARAKLHDSARAVLNKMDKAELIRLMLEKMPTHVLQALGNSATDKQNAMHLLQKAQARFNALFENEELVYDPEAFAQQLERTLQPLEGLEKIIPRELFTFSQEVMQLINNALEEGLLHDKHNDAVVEIPELFFTLTLHALAALPAQERATAEEQLLIKLSEAAYNNFEPLRTRLQKMAHAHGEQNDPKARLLSRLAILPAPYIRDEYRVLEKTLSDTEKEQVLLHIFGYTDMLMQLAELYCRTGRNEKALHLLREPVNDKEVTWLPENILRLYLRLEKEAGSNMETIGLQLIKWMPTINTLIALIQATGQQQPAWEKQLEQHGPDHYFMWLEKNNRLAEALHFAKTKKGIYVDINGFIIRHKKHFREEAETLLCRLIDEQLQRTTTNAYTEIQHCIKHIREINPEMANGIVTDIRTRFAKRRKLMELLAEA